MALRNTVGSRLGLVELRRSDRPSRTAQATAVGRAVERLRPVDQRIVDDEYASVFLTGRARSLVHVLRRGGMARLALERQRFAGLATYPLSRHAYLDHALLQALAAGVEQVLVLGAGYDSRAYRFAEAIGDRPVFEVDLAPLSRAKAALVAARPEIFGSVHVRPVEVDFQSDRLDERLRAGGVRLGAATFVVWEGVSMYLPAAAVASTLDALAAMCGPGSRLSMDLWDGGPGAAGALRRVAARSFRLLGEPVRFGVPLDGARRLLQKHGWAITDVADAHVLAEQYATDGRTVERSLYVVTAERTSAG